MKVLVRPVVDPQAEIDLTHRLVSAIAEELWKLYGGNEQLNWLEAERHLQQIVGKARAEADETMFVNMSESVWAGGLRQLGDEAVGVEERPRQQSTTARSRRRAGQGSRRRSTEAGVNAGHPLATAGC